MISAAAALVGVGLAFGDGAVAALQSLAPSSDAQGTGVILLCALVSASTSATAALGYRWYFRERIPRGIAALFGLSAAALVLNTSALYELSLNNVNLFEPRTALFNTVALGAALAVAPIGTRVGEAVATNVFAVAGAKELEGEVSSVVRSVGRVTAVTLPEEIADVDEYDPVSTETKEELAGKTLLFPRRLTVAELRDRLATRLKDDYGVGYVDADVTDEGTVEYLALGRRVAGIGPTLAPSDVAVAVRGDPAHGASVGDVVQVWRGGSEPTRVVNAEVRATAGDAATLVVDESEPARLDPTIEYRFVTLPAEPQADREFASHLRAADETMGAVVVEDGGDLLGDTVGDVGDAVVAVRSADGSVDVLPPRSRPFDAGDTVYVIARPDALRRLETNAEAQPSSPAARE
ncbi:potassium transporter TrkA [Halegenticoccus tardaugens]|uniref:potassium transporter TrkA n=1 Tax=Halegenticoccus tardaugens TaxID=2071624 RepID=UPI001E45B386|nr:potassium transporter TrkA [Halegenticoccus tardaugens]